jgi:hypothetical protein
MFFSLKEKETKWELQDVIKIISQIDFKVKFTYTNQERK